VRARALPSQVDDDGPAPSEAPGDTGPIPLRWAGTDERSLYAVLSPSNRGLRNQLEKHRVPCAGGRPNVHYSESRIGDQAPSYGRYEMPLAPKAAGAASHAGAAPTELDPSIAEELESLNPRARGTDSLVQPGSSAGQQQMMQVLRRTLP